MIIKFILLAALVKLLLSTESPSLCAGIYSVVNLVIGLAFGVPFLNVLAQVGAGFVLAWIYFWLLDRYSESNVAFWLILLGGLAIGLV